MWRVIVALLLALPATPVLAQQAGDAARAPAATSDDGIADRLAVGIGLLEKQQPARAIAEVFDPLIAQFEAQYGKPDGSVFGARTRAETLLYLLPAAGQARKVTVLDESYAYAYYLRGYALVEMARLDEAEQSLQSARTLAPHNAQFTLELAQIMQQRKAWDRMLALATQAEGDARAYSPDEARAQEEAHALRSQGYALIELGRLDEAQAKLERAIAVDPDNQHKAQSELDYIRQLRAQQR